MSGASDARVDFHTGDDDPNVLALAHGVGDGLDALVAKLRDMYEAVGVVVDADEGSERLDASDGATVY